jgi:hypothetical protein
MDKPYLISLSSNVEGVDRYLASLKNLEDSVELVFVNFEPYIPKRELPISKVHRINTGWSWPGNLRRFNYIPKELMDENRWWIFTDTSDVIFQSPIPDLDKAGLNILISYEGERFDENWVWIPILKAQSPKLDMLLTRPISCMGTWAMKGYLAREMIAFLKEGSRELPHIFNDQPIFNLWLDDKRYVEHLGLFATLYKNFYTGMITKDEDGRFWQGRVLPAIVHGNGGSKELLPKIP